MYKGRPARLVNGIYHNEDLNVSYDIEVPNSLSEGYGVFLANLPDEIKQIIKNNEKKFHNLFLEITPYLILRKFAYLFQTSWNVEIEKTNKKIKDRIKFLENYNSKKISVHEIPKLDSNSYLNTLGLDIILYLDRISFPNLFIPAELRISIQYEYGIKISLILSHPEFELKMDFLSATSGLYLVQNEPQFTYKLKEFLNLNFQEIKCDLQAKFIFPESDFNTLMII